MILRAKHRPTFARIAWLMRRLAGLKRTFKTGDLAREYEVSRKTLERDIELLRQCGALETEHINAGWEKSGLRVTALRCPCCHREIPDA